MSSDDLTMISFVSYCGPYTMPLLNRVSCGFKAKGIECGIFHCERML